MHFVHSNISDDSIVFQCFECSFFTWLELQNSGHDHCWHPSQADHLPYGAVHTNQALSLWFLEAKNW
jgi:hypothetical protein